MVFDQRSFNARKNPSIQHKLRVTNPGNKTGLNFSITVPTPIAQNFHGTYFRVFQNGTSILLESGCKLNASDISQVKDNSFNGLRMIIDKYGQTQWIK